MLTPGNKKLGGALIWGFGLPSGTRALCPGMTDVCRRHCYACALERRLPAVQARYERNLKLSGRSLFAKRLRWFILAHDIRVVRVHVGGDFYSAKYAERWLDVMRRLARRTFYFYTRSWHDADIANVLTQMAELPNVHAWYSCDRATGPPDGMPDRARIAWLQTERGDSPPPYCDLTFRVQALRRVPLTSINSVLVCPAEDGRARPQPMTCDGCGHCWELLSSKSQSPVTHLLEMP